MKKVLQTYSFTLSEATVWSLDNLVKGIRQKTEYVVSRSSALDHVISLAFEIFPALPQEVIDQIKTELSPEQRALLGEMWRQAQ